MHAFDSYTPLLVVMSTALLLLAAGIGKKHLVWRRRRPLPARRRRTP